MIEAGAATFTLDLHPRLTVVAGAGQLERDGLVGELLTALGPGRPGAHVEFTTDAGDRLALFRPHGDRPRVVDVERSLDVTHRWTDSRGTLDPLSRAGLTPSAARRLLRITAADLQASSRHDELVLRLAQLDQTRLWDVAAKVAERAEELEQCSSESGGRADDGAVVEAIEHRHAAFEAVQAANERVRAVSFAVAAFTGALVLPLAAMGNSFAAPMMALLAIGATGVSAVWWRRLSSARSEEAAALAVAGVDSYLAFTLQRVNRLVVDDHQRRRLLQARDAHRAALAQWQLLAGEVPVEWAVERRGEVRRMSAALRQAAGVRSAMTSHLSDHQRDTALIGPVLADRVAAAVTAGPGGESLPVVLDDALADLAPEAKQLLLARLFESSARVQVIYLTEADQEVIDWARMEQVGGGVALVEPRGDGSDGHRHRSRNGRSVAA